MATLIGRGKDSPPTTRAFSALARQWQRWQSLRAEQGRGAAWAWLFDRLGARLCNMTISEVVWLEVDGIQLADAPPAGFTFRFLTADEVAGYVSPVNELAPLNAHRAAAGHDLCFAALAGDRLAAYGWYALGSIEAEHCGGVPLSFPPHVAYMYKGFTHPDFRGQRLHGFVMRLALEELARTRGITRLVSTVDWLNTASLRSCDRLGYRRLGRLTKIGWPRCCMRSAPRPAKALGVRFGRKADLSNRQR